MVAHSKPNSFLARSKPNQTTHQVSPFKNNKNKGKDKSKSLKSFDPKQLARLLVNHGMPNQGQ